VGSKEGYKTPIHPSKMSLQIYFGPMFAGKSSEILRIVNRYKSIDKPMCIVSYMGDRRYSSEEMLMNHNSVGVPCKKVQALYELYDLPVFRHAKLVIIDEAQFYPDLYDFVLKTVETLKKDVVLVGLDGDADRKPFGDLLKCVPLADDVFKLKSFCKLCGDGTEALFSYCTGQKAGQVQVGGAEMYWPLCRKHYLECRGTQ